MTTKYFYCPECNERNSLRSMANDRVELEKDRGETFSVNCDNCHARPTIHVNDVQAEPNKLITGGSGVLGLVCAGMFFQLGFIAALPLALPIVVYQAQARAASGFNRYKVR